MKRTGLPDRDTVVAFAQREASPLHYSEFEPVARGPIFAVALLIPLLLLAAAWLVVGKALDLIVRMSAWRTTPPTT